MMRYVTTTTPPSKTSFLRILLGCKVGRFCIKARDTGSFGYDITSQNSSLVSSLQEARNLIATTGKSSCRWLAAMKGMKEVRKWFRRRKIS
jgi:hypothetical protein